MHVYAHGIMAAHYSLFRNKIFGIKYSEYWTISLIRPALFKITRFSKILPSLLFLLVVVDESIESHFTVCTISNRNNNQTFYWFDSLFRFPSVLLLAPVIQHFFSTEQSLKSEDTVRNLGHALSPIPTISNEKDAETTSRDTICVQKFLDSTFELPFGKTPFNYCRVDTMIINLFKIGVANASVMIGTMLVCVFLTLGKGEVKSQWWPSVSQSSNSEPARPIFILGITSTVCCFMLLAYFRWLFLRSIFSHCHVAMAQRVNTVGLLLNLVNLAQLGFVSAFDSRNYGDLHTYTAYGMFATSIVAQSVQCWLDVQWRKHLRSAHAQRFALKHVKVFILLCAALLALVSLLHTKVIDPDSVNYSLTAFLEFWLVLSVIFHWTAMCADFRFLTFSVSMVHERATVTMHPTEEIDDSDNENLLNEK
jgi:hypothetical protein